MKSKRLILPLLLLAVAGCSFAFTTVGSANSGPMKEVTFNRDVAPILFKSCAECHRSGEAAPMSLLTYKDARPWARSIKEKVVKREMPPWHADPHVGQFKNDRRLTDEQVATIAAWVDGGAKEGDPKDLPPAPKFVEGWRIGNPDLVLKMTEPYTVAASGPDEYQYFEIPTNFKEDRYIQMAEARPGNRKVVHHIIAFIEAPAKGEGGGAQHQLTKEEIEKYQAEREKNSIFTQEGFLSRMKPGIPVYDDGCNLANGGNGDTLDTKEAAGGMDLLVGYAPGMDAEIMQPGMVKKVPAGAKILLQLHYSKVTGQEEKDQSMIGLIFAKEPPDKHLYTRGIANTYFQIPPGADYHEVTSCWTADADLHIQTIMPHMHLRGKAMEVRAYYPDGRKETLLNVPNYSFSWQTVYALKQAAAIPKGTKIVVIAHFDNSTRNKYNPDATKAVRFGDPTYDEMMIGWINYTVDGQHLRNETAMNSKGAAKR